jgi:hypothetical protein
LVRSDPARDAERVNSTVCRNPSAGIHLPAHGSARQARKFLAAMQIFAADIPTWRFGAASRATVEIALN